MTTHERAVEVDTELARLWGASEGLERELGWAVDRVHNALGERRPRNRDWSEGPWPTTTEIAVEEARMLAATATTDTGEWKAREASRQVAKYDAALAAFDANVAAAQPLEDEFRADGWSRFFLVQNVGGHIHRSMHCSTTFRGTRWGWLPDLSGLTEADAVATEGTRLCSICYPTAPVEWTVGLPKKANPNQCPGSGQDPAYVKFDVTERNYRTGETRTVTRERADCPSCHRKFVNVNERSGLVRAHNLKRKK